MSRRVLFELTAPGALDDDLTGLDTALSGRNLLGHSALLKHLAGGAVTLEGVALVAGRLPFVHEGMRRLGIDRPPPLDYLGAPETLLGRRVRATTLGAVSELLDLRGGPLFVKPRGRAKQFTGRLVQDSADFRTLRVRSPSTPVWCCDVLEFISEYRAFVLRGRVVGLRHYDGDSALSPADHVVEELVSTLGERLPAGCGVDVGLTSDGRCLLVEVNDGFSLGRYGLPGETYLDVLLARWRQLVASAHGGRIDRQWRVGEREPGPWKGEQDTTACPTVRRGHE